MNAPDYAARAAAGAEFLDGEIPGWAEQIDLSQLDMASCRDCILGQLGGDYDHVAEDLGIDDGRDIGLGFMRLAGEGGHAWQLLRDAWTAEIARRREPAQVSA